MYIYCTFYTHYTYTRYRLYNYTYYDMHPYNMKLYICKYTQNNINREREWASSLPCGMSRSTRRLGLRQVRPSPSAADCHCRHHCLNGAHRMCLEFRHHVLLPRLEPPEPPSHPQTSIKPWSTLWLCQNSCWKWPFIVDFPMKNGDFP